jgi:hypothetical protein
MNKSAVVLIVVLLCIGSFLYRSSQRNIRKEEAIMRASYILVDHPHHEHKDEAEVIFDGTNYIVRFPADLPEGVKNRKAWHEVVMDGKYLREISVKLKVE